MNLRPTVGAIVVTHNRWSCLQRALEGLKRQTVPLSEVIVVDNASTDETGKEINSRFPWVNYTRLTENLGGAGGFSAGLRCGHEKGHEWLWVMDDDAVPEPDALERMIETEVIRKVDTGMLACLVVRPDGEVDQRSRAHWLDMKAFRTKAIFNGHIPPVEAIECNSATFVGILVSRAAMDQIGYPRSDFFIAYDDVEYIHRICKAGFKAYQVPKSKIVHLNAGMEDSPRGGWWLRREGPATPMWRSYYNWRNCLYLVRCHSTWLTFARKVGRFSAGVLLRDDNKLARLSVLARAANDAWSGQLGQRNVVRR